MKLADASPAHPQAGLEPVYKQRGAQKQGNDIAL